MPARHYPASNTPRWLCPHCTAIVWTGVQSGRVRDDIGGVSVHDPAHTCIAYDNGTLRQGVGERPSAFLTAEQLSARRAVIEVQDQPQPSSRYTSYTNLTRSDPEPDIPFEEGPYDPVDGESAPEDELPSLWWMALGLPDGVSWYDYPRNETGSLGQLSVVGDSPNFATIIATLREWAEEQGLEVRPFRTNNFWISVGPDRNPVLASRPFRFYIGQPNPESPFEWSEDNEWDRDFTCPYCGETHPAYTASCNGRGFICAQCQSINTDELVEADGNTYCRTCVQPCDVPECSGFAIGEDRIYCDEHRTEAYCVFCDTGMERGPHDDPFFETGEGVCCGDCAEQVCQNCNRYNRRGLTWNSDLELNVCRRCLFVGADGTTGESFDEDAELTNAQMQIPTIPGRENVRQCGIEIEGANGTGGGNELSRAFYEAELSNLDNMAGYHHGSEGGFVHVERDSSVDWEVVIGPLNPANANHIRKLNTAVRIIRDSVKDGTVGLDLRAGCHIHVEAARTSLDGAFNLNLLFAYLEDVIFRLAAARWPVHRAIMDSHYTAPIPKDLRKLQFAQEHHGSEDARYYALSFQNYFNRVLSNCHCGAVRYDSWEDCSCELGKCTFEFRVFNTTANPRKLHAYLALAQSLVAKGMSLGKLDEGTVFPALAFRSRRFKDMTETEQEEIVAEWRDRLAWMFNELPLTEPEKESLAYCVRHSELEQVGEEFIESLLSEQHVTEEVTA